MARVQDYTFTYKDMTDKRRKNLSILDYIRRRGEVSRAEVSKESGINIVSVSNYVAGYLKRGLVFECGRDISTGGRRPELLRLNLESAYVAGLDVGSEKLTAIITDLALKTKSRVTMPRPEGDMDIVIEAAAGMLEGLFKEFGKPLSEIKLIGIGLSGVVDSTSGTIRDTDPARGRTKASLFSLLGAVEKKFSIKALFGNDATCAAFGEMSLNPDSEIRDLLYLYADIGCGIIINRDIYCGATGSAGEVQLLADAKTHPEISPYSVRGMDLGIVSRAKERMKGTPEITKETIFSAAHKNDKVARELLIEAAYWLGVKAAYLINLFNPQVVVVGGGMEKAGNVFMESLSSAVKMYAFEESARAAKIQPSFLGQDAIALGAAALSVRELFVNA